MELIQQHPDTAAYLAADEAIDHEHSVVAIPAGLCYQRLTDDDGTNPGVHGLVALRLPGHERWARVDPRGNRPGVDAQFSLGAERLAWAVREEIGEVDYPAIHATSPTEVLHALRNARDRAELWQDLPTRL
ncbi:hypothetical protein [Streptomyces sp. NPDC088755]|uniref:hypothetical protein n=1 Tax=Streptomyces sp. NPDC088755 TaxID=3365888 RepID=UPI00382561FD